MKLENMMIGTGLGLVGLSALHFIMTRKTNKNSFEDEKMKCLKEVSETIENKVSLKIAILQIDPNTKEVGELEEKLLYTFVHDVAYSKTYDELKNSMNDFYKFTKSLDVIHHYEF